MKSVSNDIFEDILGVKGLIKCYDISDSVSEVFIVTDRKWFMVKFHEYDMEIINNQYQILIKALINHLVLPYEFRYK